MTPKLFRDLLIAYLVLSMFSVALNQVFGNLMPEAILHARHDSYKNLSPLSINSILFFSLVAFVGGIVSVIGLYLFRPWAPRLAVIVTVLALFIWPIQGFNVSTGYSTVLSSLSTTIWGAILAIVYFSPLKERFSANR